MSNVVLTETLAESGIAEELGNEKLEDLTFAPLAPLSAQPAAYDAGATYAKGALTTEGSQIYRSQAAGNKGNEPKADTDFVHWAPVSVQVVLPADPNIAFAAATRTQQAHNNKPPASSAATATAAETIGVGAETLV